jgi:hypothetical protein
LGVFVSVQLDGHDRQQTEKDAGKRVEAQDRGNSGLEFDIDLRRPAGSFIHRGCD